MDYQGPPSISSYFRSDSDDVPSSPIRFLYELRVDVTQGTLESPTTFSYFPTSSDVQSSTVEFLCEVNEQVIQGSSSTASYPPTSSDEAQSPSVVSFCEICEDVAQGTHFGAGTCRACAAFFRRTVHSKLVYHCRSTGDCIVLKNRTMNSCRSCRYDKCIQVGMVPDNIQYDRDTTSSTDHKKQRVTEKKKELAVIPGKLPGWRITVKDPPVFDLSNLFRRIKRIFSKFKEPSDPFYLKANTLSRMDWVLRNFREPKRKTHVHIRNEFSIDEMVQDKGGFTKRAAEWMMHSEEFRWLSTPEKFQVFMETWQIWDKLCKIQQGCEHFGKQVLEDRLFMMSTNEACRMDTVCIDYSTISKKPSHEIRKMMHPIVDQMFKDIVPPLLDLQPSSIEITYLLCNVAFGIASNKFANSPISAALDLFLENVSNNLHEYYIKKRSTHYAARLLKLMRIVNSLQQLFKERKKLIALAQLFDVFSSNVCEPKFFG